MRQLCLTDSLRETLKEMDRRGVFYTRFKMPRRSGATTSLVNLAKGLAMNPENTVVISFAKASIHAEVDFSGYTVISTYAANLVNKIRGLSGAVYILVDTNGAYHYGELERLANIHNGRIKILALDTAIF